MFRKTVMENQIISDNDEINIPPPYVFSNNWIVICLKYFVQSFLPDPLKHRRELRMNYLPSTISWISLYPH